MKVRALFVDYDGTIAPIGVPRSESRVLRGVEMELLRMARETPVCVVTAKDYGFIHSRCGFAAGWACSSGLDVRMADGEVKVASPLRRLDGALKLARSWEGAGTITELKRGPSRELLGVTIDWSGAPELGTAVVHSLGRLAKKGGFVAYDGSSTFADVYAARPDKGKAVKVLKGALGVEMGVMFIGDSALDNAAFRVAEMAIGVAHGQPTSELRCDHIVDQNRLAAFLRSLHGRGMEFSPSLPWVRRQGGK